MTGRGEAEVRAAVVETSRRLADAGLNRGTSGNVSARIDPERFLITPSGVRPGELGVDDLVILPLAAESPSDASTAGGRQPSSEWRLHHAILRARPDAEVVVHAHPVHATALACLVRRIPAFHYMVAVVGGDSIECAPYARFGTQALADAAVTALDGRSACLLAHHGLVALGCDAEMAMERAIEVEGLAEMYLACLAVEEPPTLSSDQMAEVHRRFATYGSASGDTDK